MADQSESHTTVHDSNRTCVSTKKPCDEKFTHLITTCASVIPNHMAVCKLGRRNTDPNILQYRSLFLEQHIKKEP